MTTSARVLIVDDDIKFLKLLSSRLESENYKVITCQSTLDAFIQLAKNWIDVIITDMRIEPDNDFVFLQNLQVDYPDIPVIMLTEGCSIPDAIAATKQGVFAFLTKPFDQQKLFNSLQQAIQLYGKNADGDEKATKVKSSNEFSDHCYPGIISRSQSMLLLQQQIRRLANTDVNILICGESGTGKELLANAIHNYRRPQNSSFVAVNCGAIPAELLESEFFGHKKGAFTGAIKDHVGLFERANGGTLFLDEIGDMSLSLQVKLLRVLQDKKIRPIGSTEEITVDAQIISATHRNLTQSIAERHFREDLYYRLNVINLNLPPLRERKEDIPLLVRHFTQNILKRVKQTSMQHTAQVFFSPEALKLIVEHQWTGNIRELQNLIEQVVALNAGELITEVQILKALNQEKTKQNNRESLSNAKRQFEKNYLLEKLAITQGNVAEAAILSGRNRSDFYKLLKKHNIAIECQ